MAIFFPGGSFHLKRYLNTAVARTIDKLITASLSFFFQISSSC